MVFVVAEIGNNHLGNASRAIHLVECAAKTGADAVKFQRRTLPFCVPIQQAMRPKSTPWGTMQYLQYREKIELEDYVYTEIAAAAARLNIKWSASVWDEHALKFLLNHRPDYIKIPSALLTNDSLLFEAGRSGEHVMLSTGMSTMKQLRHAVELLQDVEADFSLLHCTACYPTMPLEINLETMNTLRAEFPGVPIGYSGHEQGLAVSFAAAGMGAEIIERHFTYDRSEWTPDHKVSLSMKEMTALCKGVAQIERAMGDGIKRVYERELPAIKKLRGP